MKSSPLARAVSGRTYRLGVRRGRSVFTTGAGSEWSNLIRVGHFHDTITQEYIERSSPLARAVSGRTWQLYRRISDASSPLARAVSGRTLSSHRAAQSGTRVFTTGAGSEWSNPIFRRIHGGPESSPLARAVSGRTRLPSLRSLVYLSSPLARAVSGRTRLPSLRSLVYLSSPLARAVSGRTRLPSLRSLVYLSSPLARAVSGRTIRGQFWRRSDSLHHWRGQ